MANVQTVTGPQTALSGAPLSINPAPDAFGANVAGEGLQKVGAATEQVSDMLGKRALTVQAINNQSAADQANQQFAYLTAQSRDKYKNDLLGALSKNPELDTGAFLGSYLKQNEADRNALADGLGNVMAKQMFHQESRRLASLNAGQLSAETASAWRESGINTAKASMQLYQSQAIYAGGDTSTPAVQGSMLGIWNQVRKVAKIRGDSPDAQRALFQSAVSPIFEKTFDVAVDTGDIEKAKGILAAHAAHDLTPDALGRMYGALKVSIFQNSIKDPLDQIFYGGKAPTVGGEGSSPDAQDEAFISQESDNHDNVQVSVNGAHGPAQILPGTFAAYAKPGESIDNPADNRAVQKRILADYRQRYNGDIGRMATAFFSGPGNVAPAGSPTPYIHDYKDGNGKHVSSYVADMEARTSTRTFGEAPPTFGDRPQPADIKEQMEDYVERVAKWAYPNSAAQRDAFITHGYSLAGKMAQKEYNKQLGIEQQLEGFLDKGLPDGRSVHSSADFPPSMYNQLSDGFRSTLDKQVNLAVNGVGGFDTPEMTANAASLMALSGKDTIAFLNTDLSKEKLSASDWKSLTRLQAQLGRSDVTKAQHQAKYAALEANPIVKNIVAQQFQQEGAKFADVRPTEGGQLVESPGHMSFMGALMGEVERAQAKSTKPLSDEEVGKIANNLLVQKAGENNPDFIFIPARDKEYLTRQSIKHYGRIPTPDELAYWYHQRRDQ